jgi:hypothetical protein
MKPKVYIETTIVSYLTARPSRDIVIAGHQQVTHEWWQASRSHFDLVTSQMVVREASAGDPEASHMRSKIEEACRTAGYEPAVICTPEELMEV